MQTNIRGGRWLGVAALVLALQGCGDPKSSSTSGPEGGPVATSRMTIALTVEAKDLDQAVVRANLNDGKPAGDSYRLDGGDYFRACISGVCRTMADNDSITSPDYIARFDFQPGVDYVVSFNRQGAQNAPDSRVHLAQPFTIVTPANHQQVTDGDAVVVSWSPTGAPAAVTLDYKADCTFLSGGHGYSSGDLGTDSNGDGRENVAINPIIDFARTGATSTITGCSIDVKVSHELQGQIDPAFHNGTARGIVSRVVNLAYVPR